MQASPFLSQYHNKAYRCQPTRSFHLPIFKLHLTSICSKALFSRTIEELIDETSGRHGYLGCERTAMNLLYSSSSLGLLILSVGSHPLVIYIGTWVGGQYKKLPLKLTVYVFSSSHHRLEIPSQIPSDSGRSKCTDTNQKSQIIYLNNIALSGIVAPSLSVPGMGGTPSHRTCDDYCYEYLSILSSGYSDIHLTGGHSLKYLIPGLYSRSGIQLYVLISSFLRFTDPVLQLAFTTNQQLVSVDYARDVEIRNSSKSVAYRINYCQIYRLGRGRCEERTKTNNTRHTYSADNLSNRREPLILTNSVVSRWKAIQLWKGRKYLSNHQDLQDMNDVQCSKENTFGFKDNKTMLAALQLPGLDLSTRFIQKNMTGPSFFDQLDVPGDDFKKFGLYMWLSSDDVRPPIHYDMDHNFYVHISGRTHPMWHKSQCQYDACQSVSSTDCACPNFLKAEAREATLEGGEVLYIPPYWWHHVQSITASVSLASWSSSGVTRSMSFLWSRRLSFESVEHPEAKRAWLIYFIERLYSRTYGRDAQKRMRMMMDVRWKPLRSLFEDGWVEVCRAEEITEENKKKIEEDVEYVITKLEDCQGAVNGVEWSTQRRDVGAIRDLELMDYIEVLASGVVGADCFYPFFKHCLLTNPTIQIPI
ncbi:hypothetical protein PROFUN_14846 [Planoprotostelium fungivorum]|uniref:JmjC domain-containing protein n=1 Tax=Planoprotostelium fungivorum TaxID=1890364 RepID=A0A2P6MYQ6_9EUKA|nr:hypothetical protein PROFUN_14846 [Planoprotostelium fungivorum]